MISEKDYFNLCKEIPYVSCPDDLPGKVLQKCGLTGGRHRNSTLVHNVAYGMASLMIVLALGGLAVWKDGFKPVNNVRLAENSQSLFQQVTQSTYAVLTDSKH